MADDPVAAVAALRDRLVALDAARARGGVDDAYYESARRELERALADAVLATPPAAAPVGRRPSKPLLAAVGLGVVVVALAGYSFTGSPSLAGLGTPPAAPAQSSPPGAAGNATSAGTGPEASASERAIGMQQIAAMVDKLAARMKEKPDDAEGWTMLARSYAVLSRYPEALPAYEHAVALQPKDAGLIADYADAVAAANGGKQNSQSLALIERAIAVDPTQPKALALAGTVAFDRGDYAGAVAYWQKIADALPPDSEFQKQVVADIDEARRRGNLPTPPGAGRKAAPAAPPMAASAASSGPARTTASSPGAGGREALSGTVTLDASLAAQVAPGDTVFVLARPVGGRMPLAVMRATVKDLPLAFRLDDSMAMTPAMKISDQKEVVVAARVSKSGNAITQAGDFAGESAPVAPGTHEIAIAIARPVQ